MDIVLYILCFIVFFGGIYFFENKKKTENEMNELKKKEESDFIELEGKNKSLKNELLSSIEDLNKQTQITISELKNKEESDFIKLEEKNNSLKNELLSSVEDLNKQTQITISELKNKEESDFIKLEEKNNSIKNKFFSLAETLNNHIQIIDDKFVETEKTTFLQLNLLETNLEEKLSNVQNIVTGLDNDLQKTRLDYNEQLDKLGTYLEGKFVNMQNSIGGLSDKIELSKLDYNEQLRQLVEVLLNKISTIKQENDILRKKLEYFTEIKEDSSKLNESVDIEKENELIQNILKFRLREAIHEKTSDPRADEETKKYIETSLPVFLKEEVAESVVKDNNSTLEDKTTEVEKTKEKVAGQEQVDIFHNQYELIECFSIEEQYKKIQENLKNGTVYFTINDSYSLEEYIGTTQKLDAVSSLYPNKKTFYCRFAGHSIGNGSIQAFLLKKAEKSPSSFAKINTIPGLDPVQEKAYQLMENTNRNIFISGKAGTGKSFLLRLFCAGTKKKHLIVAPTGIAALNVDGVTIHSAFGYDNLELGSALDFVKLKSEKKEVLKNIDVLIIDEISMLRADVLDKMNVILQKVNDSSELFGGKQVFVFGDLFQLPPIVNQNEAKYLYDNYGGIFFFYSKAYNNGDFQYIELNENHRQNTDPEFFDILSNIRKGITTNNDIISLNTRYTPSPDLRRILKLYPRKEMVEKVNNDELSKIDAKEYVFEARVEFERDANVPKNKENIFPISFVLKLKLGALIMMVKNDVNRRWVNGTLGIISSLDQNHVKVTIDGIEYEIGKESFESKEAKYSEGKIYYEPILSVIQYPLILAYAITIHKSQGMTYKNIACDLTNTFESGQSYVALSRCSSLNGLHLMTKITGKEIRVSPQIIAFYEKITSSVAEDKIPLLF